MNSRRLRLGLAVILFIFGLAVLVYATQLPLHLEQTVPMPPVTLPMPTPLAWSASWVRV